MTDKTMQYHEMAAFMFLLFLVAKDRTTGALFNDFEDQLKSLPPGMSLPYKDFHRILLGVQQTIAGANGQAQRDKYLGLFNNAHEAVKNLFQSMAADALWDVCRAVDFEKLKSIVTLTLVDLEARAEFERKQVAAANADPKW